MSAVISETPTPTPLSMPSGLDATDRLMRKWGMATAKDSGAPRTIHALERIRLMRDGAVFSSPAPEPEEFALIDRILASSPKETQTFIVIWYCAIGRTATQKADLMAKSRAKAYADLRMHLSYIKGRLNSRGVRV